MMFRLGLPTGLHKIRKNLYAVEGQPALIIDW